MSVEKAQAQTRMSNNVRKRCAIATEGHGSFADDIMA